MVSTYSEAGVDIDASERATEALIAQIKGVNRKRTKCYKQAFSH